MNESDQGFIRILYAIGQADRPVFIHNVNTFGVGRWHYGDCFPDVDTCCIPNGADLDAGDAS